MLPGAQHAELGRRLRAYPCERMSDRSVKGLARNTKTLRIPSFEMNPLRYTLELRQAPSLSNKVRAQVNTCHMTGEAGPRCECA